MPIQYENRDHKYYNLLHVIRFGIFRLWLHVRD